MTRLMRGNQECILAMFALRSGQACEPIGDNPQNFSYN